jgi:hypothetical protein
MNRIGQHISLIFATILVIGTTLSAIHVHFDYYPDSETQHQWVEDELNCVICGAVFQFSADTDSTFETILPEHFGEESAIQPGFYKPFDSFRDGRAPPFTA